MIHTGCEEHADSYHLYCSSCDVDLSATALGGVATSRQARVLEARVAPDLQPPELLYMVEFADGVARKLRRREVRPDILRTFETTRARRRCVRSALGRQTPSDASWRKPLHPWMGCRPLSTYPGWRRKQRPLQRRHRRWARVARAGGQRPPALLHWPLQHRRRSLPHRCLEPGDQARLSSSRRNNTSQNTGPVWIAWDACSLPPPPHSAACRERIEERILEDPDMSAQVHKYMERWQKAQNAEPAVVRVVKQVEPLKSAASAAPAAATPKVRRPSRKFATGRRKARLRAQKACRQSGAPTVADDWLAITDKDLAAAASCPVNKEHGSGSARRVTGCMQTFVLQCGQVLAFCDFLRGESLQLVYAMLLRLVGMLRVRGHDIAAVFYDNACGCGQSETFVPPSID